MGHESYLHHLRGQLLESGGGFMVTYVRHRGHILDTYAYTVGLTAWDDHPELLVVGISVHDAHYVLSTLGMDVVAGRRLRHGEIVDDILTCAYPLAIVGPIGHEADERYPIMNARGLFTDAGPPYQVVYTDDNYRFPWHDGYDMNLHQPLLAPVPEVR